MRWYRFQQAFSFVMWLLKSTTLAWSYSFPTQHHEKKMLLLSPTTHMKVWRSSFQDFQACRCSHAVVRHLISQINDCVLADDNSSLFSRYINSILACRAGEDWILGYAWDCAVLRISRAPATGRLIAFHSRVLVIHCCWGSLLTGILS